MNPTLLLLFSGSLLGTFYLYFLAAKRLRSGHLGAGVGIGMASVVTSAICLYGGVLTIQTYRVPGVLSEEVARSVFHIEVWPWLVPISSLCIFFLWLMGHALRAFGDHATKRALGLSAAAMVCLVPLGYSMFVLSFFAIFTGPPKSESELIAEFEHSTGLDYPDSAIIKELRTYRSDRFGDWQGSLIFEIPSLTLDTYRQLPETNWQNARQWQVWHQTICCDWDPSEFPDFLPPDGAAFVVDDEGHYKFLAIDRPSGTVYFLRSSW